MNWKKLLEMPDLKVINNVIINLYIGKKCDAPARLQCQCESILLPTPTAALKHHGVIDMYSAGSLTYCTVNTHRTIHRESLPLSPGWSCTPLSPCCPPGCWWVCTGLPLQLAAGDKDTQHEYSFVPEYLWECLFLQLKSTDEISQEINGLAVFCQPQNVLTLAETAPGSP